MNGNSAVITARDFGKLHHLLQSPYSRVHGPMTRLRQELSGSQVVAPVKVGRDVVTMNSRVRVRDLESDTVRTYTLVYPADADVDEGKISVAAPLGAALLGAKLHQVIEFAAPRGFRRIRIERILYQPERSGDYDI